MDRGRVGKSSERAAHLACANETDEYDDHTFGTVLDGIEVTVHCLCTSPTRLSRNSCIQKLTKTRPRGSADIVSSNTSHFEPAVGVEPFRTSLEPPPSVTQKTALSWQCCKK